MASVLISGAGPVGLTMANELARYGVAVRIVDKAAARTDKSKALVLWSRTLELFDHARLRRAVPPAGMSGAWRADLERQGRSWRASASTTSTAATPTR